MKSFILFTVSAVLLGLLLVPFNNNNNEGVAVVCALDVTRNLHQTIPTLSQERQQQHEKHGHHEQHTRHSKKAPGWEKALKKDSKSKSKSTESTSKSVKSKSIKSKSTKSKSTTDAPKNRPTNAPTNTPTNAPTNTPTNAPTNTPTNKPTDSPTNKPTDSPTHVPTNVPTDAPTNTPTNAPTDSPTDAPTKERSIAVIICDPDNADVFGRLCEALNATNVLQKLDDQRDGTYTLFAPNNSALLNTDIETYGDSRDRQQIMLTHVLVGEFSTNELVCDGCYGMYTMVNGEITETKCDGDFKYQKGDGNRSSKGGNPQIVSANANIQATNGIIHEIDWPIFPDFPRIG